MGRRRIDMTGQQFGMLTVMEPAGNLNGHTAWRCRCDCGREAVIRTDHLRIGHARSCGCQKTEIQKRLTFVDGTCLELLESKKLRRNNTSGTTGVYWIDSIKRWRAAICFKGQRKILGQFEQYEEAVQARREAEHSLHDAFLRTRSSGRAGQTGSVGSDVMS